MKRTISILFGAIISIGAMAQNALNHSSLCINKTFIELHKDKTKKSKRVVLIMHHPQKSESEKHDYFISLFSPPCG